MPDWLVTAITIIGSVGASSGFWAYVIKRSDKQGASIQLLLGLAHDKIIEQGMTYIRRGSITKDEYDDFFKYFVNPYSQFGGNGLADKIVSEVKKLPIHTKLSVGTGSLEIVAQPPQGA